MTNAHKYSTTFETTDSTGAVTSSVECCFHYTYYPGCPDIYDKSIGGPGGWSPGDPPELEVTGIHQEFFLPKGTVEWRPVEDKELYDILFDWAMNDLLDELVHEAVEASRDKAFLMQGGR